MNTVFDFLHPHNVYYDSIIAIHKTVYRDNNLCRVGCRMSATSRSEVTSYLVKPLYDTFNYYLGVALVLQQVPRATYDS